MKFMIFSLLSASFLFAEVSYFEYGKKVELIKLKETRNAKNKVVTQYLTPNNKVVGVKDEILVSCNSDIDCADYLKKYNFKKVEKISSSIFLVKISESQDIFEKSIDLHNDKAIKFAHPNFIKARKKR